MSKATLTLTSRPGELPSNAEAKPGEDGVPHVVWLVGNEAPAYAHRLVRVGWGAFSGNPSSALTTPKTLKA
jgi:hypothetical protein